MTAVGKIEVWARPASRQERVEWDEWRHRWVISCHEPPTGGHANDAIVRLVAKTLGVPPSSVRLLSGTRTPKKHIEVEGVSDAEIAKRLESAGQRSASAGG